MTQLTDAAFGADAVRLRTAYGPAWVVASAKAIPEELRRRTLANQCKDFRYYELLEESLRTQFDHRYLILSDEASGNWAVQPLFFVDQDLLAGLPMALRRLFQPIRKIWPGFLKLRMLMIGCCAAEGQLDSSETWALKALREAIAAYRKVAGASMILFKDFPASYRGVLDVLSGDGYQRAPSMPAAFLKLDFATFDEFLEKKLSRVFRKSLRRKFRTAEAAAPIVMEVMEDVSSCVDELYALHLQTFHRSDFKFEELNREYFTLIGQRMPDRVRYFVWRQNGRIVAFNLCLVHEGTLYDLDVGLDYSVALEIHLYFVTWRNVIEWCLKSGVTTYHTGPLNYDPKLHLKMTLAPQDLYARHNSALLNPIFKLVIKYLEPTRHDPLLRRFHNAADLW